MVCVGEYINACVDSVLLVLNGLAVEELAVDGSELFVWPRGLVGHELLMGTSVIVGLHVSGLRVTWKPESTRRCFEKRERAVAGGEYGGETEIC